MLFFDAIGYKQNKTSKKQKKTGSQFDMYLQNWKHPKKNININN